MISRRKFIQNTGAGLFVTAIPYTTNALNNIKKYESQYGEIAVPKTEAINQFDIKPPDDTLPN